MLRGDESGQGAALVRERSARQGTGRPIIIALVILGVAVISVLTLQIRLLLRGDRPVARVDRDDPVPTVAARDYGPPLAMAKMPARPSNALAPEGSGEVKEPDEPIPGPLSMMMSPQEATRLLVSKELKTLERSGPASGTLTSEAVKAVDNLKRLPALAGVEFSDFRCYEDGCAVTVTSRSDDKTRRAITHSRDFAWWPGATFISGPQALASGQVQAVIVLHTGRTPTSR